MIRSFEEETEYTVGEQCLYLILGCNTTTIYTTEYLSKEVSVLCMESLNGNPDMLKMLLAHEFTHLIRKQLLRKIFLIPVLVRELLLKASQKTIHAKRFPA